MEPSLTSDPGSVSSSLLQRVRLRDPEKGQVVCTMLSLRDSQDAAISPDGHFRGSRNRQPCRLPQPPTNRSPRNQNTDPTVDRKSVV